MKKLKMRMNYVAISTCRARGIHGFGDLLGIFEDRNLGATIRTKDGFVSEHAGICYDQPKHTLKRRKVKKHISK